MKSQEKNNGLNDLSIDRIQLLANVSLKQKDVNKIIEYNNKRYLIDTETGEVFEIFVDKSSTNRERPWRRYKIANQDLETCYNLLYKFTDDDSYFKRALRLHFCSKCFTVDVFSDKFDNNKEITKITHAQFCKQRLCPTCNFRRSMKIRSNMSKILDAMQLSETKYTFLLLTLTVRNCTSDNLCSTLDDMFDAFHRFMKYRDIKNAVAGWYRALEITHNVDKYVYKYSRNKLGKKIKVPLYDDAGHKIVNESYDTYHPHFHIILAVRESYFHNNYITQKDFLRFWQKAMRDDTITQVDVRKVKVDNNKDIFKAVCEAAKYTVKSVDYVNLLDLRMSCHSVFTLDKALYYRRLVAFGGIMKELHKSLNLDDEVDGDLLLIDDDTNEDFLREFNVFWNVGYNQYIIY